MGYTHAWSYVPDDMRFISAFPRIREDATVIVMHLAASGFDLAGPNGDGEPVLSDMAIAFNGTDPHAGDTFLLSLEPLARQRLQADSGSWFSWAFCKTNRLPYDLAVMAVLLRTHQLVPELLALGSAGCWEVEWRPARDLIEGLFEPAPPRCPLTDASRGPATVRTAAPRD